MIQENNEKPEFLYGDYESTGLRGKNVVTEFSMISDHPRKQNVSFNQEIRTNSTDFYTAHAIVVQKTNLSEIRDKNKLSSYHASVQRHIFLSKLQHKIVCFHNPNFDIGLENVDSVCNLFEPYALSKNNRVLDTVEMVTTASLLNPIDIDLFDDSRGGYTRSLDYLIPKVLSKPEDHRSLPDAINTKEVVENFLKLTPELRTSLNECSREEYTGETLKKSLFLQATFSKLNGPNYSLYSYLMDFEWKGWPIVLRISNDFDWSGSAHEIYERLKKDSKPTIIKTKKFNLFFGDDTNIFDILCPNFSKKYNIKEGIKLIRNDEEFKKECFNKLKIKYSKPKEREFSDIFHSQDGFFSVHDRQIARMFHNGDANEKLELFNEFEDEKLKLNAKIIMLHNFKYIMPNKLIKDVLDYELSELEKPEASRITYETFMKSYDDVCSDPKWPKEVINNLNEYKAHVLALKANPKLFLEV